MIGKHMAAAIQKTGDLFGQTGQKIALTKYEQEEQMRREAEKERIRAEERAEDRAWQEQKLEASTAATQARIESQERRHQENIAAAKERQLEAIRAQNDRAELDRQSRESIASARLERGENAELTPKQKIDVLRREVEDIETRLSEDAYTLSDEQRADLERRAARLRGELSKDVERLTGTETKIPNAVGDIRFDKGLIGQGLGAMRAPESDKPTPKSDNQGVRTQEQFDAAYKAAKPGDVIRYWDEASGTWKGVRKVGN